MPRRPNSLVGQIFNNLTVIEYTNKRASDGSVLWLCECKCGNTRLITGSDLKRESVKSCGCLKSELVAKARTTHGNSASKRNNKIPTPIYDLWNRIKSRCYNVNNKDYKRYGGRGIKMYKIWIEDYVAFENYVISLPKFSATNKYLTIDRVNNNKGYTPGNLRWASSKEQNRNKGDNIFVELNNDKILLVEAVEKYAIVSYKIAYSRLEKGWSVDKALFTKKRGTKKHIRMFNRNKAPGNSV